MCVNNLPKVALDSGEAGIQTHDLLIASPASQPLGHRATQIQYRCYEMIWCAQSTDVMLSAGSNWDNKAVCHMRSPVPTPLDVVDSFVDFTACGWLSCLIWQFTDEWF